MKKLTTNQAAQIALAKKCMVMVQGTEFYISVAKTELREFLVQYPNTRLTLLPNTGFLYADVEM